MKKPRPMPNNRKLSGQMPERNIAKCPKEILPNNRMSDIVIV